MIDDDEEMPDEIVQYSGTKTIVDQRDRSRVILLSVSSNENGDTDQMKKILDSFAWK